ncbi:MAG: hypothetical protein IAE95_14955 [Chitinophagaceae bacterium]|nr:hypothetical protein [Chitinophagaceae bacterium]
MVFDRVWYFEIASSPAGAQCPEAPRKDAGIIGGAVEKFGSPSMGLPVTGLSVRG